MSHAVKTSSLTNLKKDIDGILSSEITRRMQLGDVVRTGNASSEISCRLLDSDTDVEAVNIAQSVTNIQSTGTAECLQEYNLLETEHQSPSEWEKDVLVDQQYWERNGFPAQRENNSRTKYRATQRLTIRQINNIANLKAADRDPSYFKFDSSTTATLKMLIDKHYLGPLHNIVSEGSNSVVIHANCPENSAVNVSFSSGNAVKVYKLTNDVKKNIAILKRAQREYEHLRMIAYSGNVHYPVYKMKNILIFGFVGHNQETAPLITKLPPEHFKNVYKMIVDNMDKWYNKFKIVHGNICSKNILFVMVQEYYYNTPFFLYIIGWGHTVKTDHPRALMKLMRDCHFVTNFFRRRDVPVKSTEELFKSITGLPKISSKVLDVIYKKNLWQGGHLTNPNR